MEKVKNYSNCYLFFNSLSFILSNDSIASTINGSLSLYTPVNFFPAYVSFDSCNRYDC